MEKYKICPFCGKKNLPTILECEECETDLSTIRVTDDALEQRLATVVETEAVRVVPSKMIRVCEECGTHNAANARKCISCGEDISDIAPQEESVVNSVKYVLSSIDGIFAYQVADGETIIGREETLSEYLGSKPYVSRKHAKILLADGVLRIQNYSQTNYTYVNDQKVSDEGVELHDGDEIGLGGKQINNQRQDKAAYFVVRIGSCL